MFCHLNLTIECVIVFLIEFWIESRVVFWLICIWFLRTLFYKILLNVPKPDKFEKFDVVLVLDILFFLTSVQVLLTDLYNKRSRGGFILGFNVCLIALSLSYSSSLMILGYLSSTPFYLTPCFFLPSFPGSAR